MQRRKLLFGLISVMVPLATCAFAATFADDVIAQLSQQGFTGISTETTWLGRVRILAERTDGQREIVLNPRTGEILRDIWTGVSGGEVAKPILSTSPPASGNAGGASPKPETGPSGSQPSGSSGSRSSGGSGEGSVDSGSNGGSSGGGSDGSGSGTGGGSVGPSNGGTSGPDRSGAGSGTGSGPGSGGSEPVEKSDGNGTEKATGK